LDNESDESDDDDDDNSNHFVDRNWTENHDDRVDDDRAKIFVDVHLLLMELMNHDWIFCHCGNFHALKKSTNVFLIEEKKKKEYL
jgi:hypothetical protein